MITGTVPHPRIVSPEQWLAERKKLLLQEKELTKQRDRVNAQRRQLAMVKIEKDYASFGINADRAGDPQYFSLCARAWESPGTICVAS